MKPGAARQAKRTLPAALIIAGAITASVTGAITASGASTAVLASAPDTASNQPPYKVIPYKIIKVTQGGSLSGQVTFTGALPDDAIEHIQITKNKDVCGDTRKVTWVDVKDTALRGTFVYLEDVSEGKDWPHAGEPDMAPLLEQKACRFLPWAQVARPGQITIRNSDAGILHNVHASELMDHKDHDNKRAKGLGRLRKTLFKFGQPNPGDITERLTPRRSTHLSVKCEVHNFMYGWMLVPDHPYGVVVDARGRFLLEDIPPGRYTLTAWHPVLGMQTRAVEIMPKANLTTRFEFSARLDKSQKR